VTIHEAFAAGIPVITSDIGGMKELVEPGKNGLLFRAGSVPHLTRKLDEFTQKNKLRERLIKGIKNVKTIEEHGNELLTIYQRAMDDLN
jgi:glycosyltransferase involved in cell wall biosynthesis